MNTIFSRAAVAAASLMCMSVTAWAQALPVQQKMDQMHGDCAAFSWNLSNELALWQGQASPIASSTDAQTAPTITIGQVHDISLEPHADVTFIATPEQDRGAPDKFSGLVKINFDTPGTYRISAGNGLWIDLVSNGDLVHSERFEMQTGCDQIFKSIAYQIDAPAHTTLQLSGSQTESVKVLITPWSD